MKLYQNMILINVIRTIFLYEMSFIIFNIKIQFNYFIKKHYLIFKLFEISSL